jgi:hypothetical protein
MKLRNSIGRNLPPIRNVRRCLFSRSFALVIVLSCGAWASSNFVGAHSASGQDGDSKAKNSTSSKPTEKPAPEVESSGAPPAIGNLFPVGRTFRGVKIPSYAGDILNSVVLAQTMVRVDDEHLEMRDLEITLFARSSEEQDTLITTDVGVYDLKSEILTSRSKAFIERDDEFTMEGDRMIFNGKTQEGRLVGNVKMRIFKISETFSNP